MLAILGLMIGLYIIASYSEMFKNAGMGAKIILIILSFITLLCIGSLFALSARMPKIP
ncbi:MAG: hypothetical protein WCI77_03885 [Candidatus Omnitrophota bacterium]